MKHNFPFRAIFEMDEIVKIFTFCKKVSYLKSDWTLKDESSEN